MTPKEPTEPPSTKAETPITTLKKLSSVAAILAAAAGLIGVYQAYNGYLDNRPFFSFSRQRVEGTPPKLHLDARNVGGRSATSLDLTLVAISITLTDAPVFIERNASSNDVAGGAYIRITSSNAIAVATPLAHFFVIKLDYRDPATARTHSQIEIYYWGGIGQDPELSHVDRDHAAKVRRHLQTTLGAKRIIGFTDAEAEGHGAMERINIWEILTAIGAIGAVVMAWRALEPARKAIEFANQNLVEMRKSRRLATALEFSERFSSTEMHSALSYLGDKRDQFGNDTQKMVEAYVTEVRDTPKLTVCEWSVRRRKVSKFFVATAAMCRADLLDEAILAEQLQRAAFDLYIDTVAPLDEAHTTQIMGRKDFDSRTREFFAHFRERQFGKARKQKLTTL